MLIRLSDLIVTIAVGIQDNPASAPKQGEWMSYYKLFHFPALQMLYPP